jgi:hypothetical protein
MDTGYSNGPGTNFTRWASGQFAYYDGNVTAKTGIAGRDSLYSAEYNWETTELWKWANFLRLQQLFRRGQPQCQVRRDRRIQGRLRQCHDRMLVPLRLRVR